MREYGKPWLKLLLFSGDARIELCDPFPIPSLFRFSFFSIPCSLFQSLPFWHIAFSAQWEYRPPTLNFPGFTNDFIRRTVIRFPLGGWLAAFSPFKLSSLFFYHIQVGYKRPLWDMMNPDWKNYFFLRLCQVLSILFEIVSEELFLSGFFVSSIFSDPPWDLIRLFRPIAPINAIAPVVFPNHHSVLWETSRRFIHPTRCPAPATIASFGWDLRPSLFFFFRPLLSFYDHPSFI